MSMATAWKLTHHFLRSNLRDLIQKFHQVTRHLIEIISTCGYHAKYQQLTQTIRTHQHSPNATSFLYLETYETVHFIETTSIGASSCYQAGKLP